LLAPFLVGTAQTQLSGVDVREQAAEISEGWAVQHPLAVDEDSPDAPDIVRTDSDGSKSGAVFFTHPACNLLSGIHFDPECPAEHLNGHNEIVSGKTARGPPPSYRTLVVTRG